MFASHPKLNTLVRLSGFDCEVDFLSACCSDTVVTGICMNAHCDYTDDVEPDCNDGYCEDCETSSVQSPLFFCALI